MKEKRKFPRFPIKGLVTCSRNGRQITMRTLNISLGGLKSEANFDIRIGDIMDLAILINGTRIQCRGTILAIEEFGNKVQARLRFTRTSDSEHKKLSDYLQIFYWGRFLKWVIGGIFILLAYIAYLFIRHHL